MRIRILGFIFAGLVWLEAAAAPNVAAYLDGWPYGDSAFQALASDGTVWEATHFDGYTQYLPLCGENFGGVADILPGTVKQVPGLQGVVALSGRNALKADGTVWSWQYMAYTRKSSSSAGFGENLIGLPLKAEQIPGLGNVVQVASNYALKSDGSVWRWSREMAAYDPQKPCYFRKWGLTPVEKIAGIDQVVSLKFYRQGILALKADGSVWTWWDATPTRIPNLENVTAIFAGWYNAFALKTDGSVLGWGDNTSFQLGSTHRDLNSSATPVALPDLGNDVKQIVVGDSHVAAVKQDGSVWGWGISGWRQICPEGSDPCPAQSAQFPDASVPGYLTPVKLRGVGDDFLSISAGVHNFTIVKQDGSIYIIGATEADYGFKADTTLAQSYNYYFSLYPSLNLLTPPQKTDTDRVLDWAEQDYASYFAPAGIATRSAIGYDFRYYPHTNSYLGTRDGRVWYLAPGLALEGIVDVGSLAERLTDARGKGF